MKTPTAPTNGCRVLGRAGHFCINGLQLLALLPLFTMVWTSVAYAAEPFRVFVSPSGSDRNGGLSNRSPVKTLSRAQDVLEAYNPDQPIEIHINPGTYRGQSVNWTYTNGHTITFTPANFSKERPIFDGGGTVSTWFKLTKSNQSASNLKFRYIRVQHYNTAMSFNGDRNGVDRWNSGNELYGMYFYKIGGVYTTFKLSTAAVRFVNSRNNSVVNSHFVDILNSRETASAIHAIYFAHYSSNNQVLRNQFIRINGDPIKVRDESNYNYIADNKFYYAGKFAYYEGWYCNQSARNDCTKSADECPSKGNVLRNNSLYGGYSNSRQQVFKITEDDNYCGRLSTPRLRTFGNFRFGLFK